MKNLIKILLTKNIFSEFCGSQPLWFGYVETIVQENFIRPCVS